MINIDVNYAENNIMVIDIDYIFDIIYNVTQRSSCINIYRDIIMNNQIKTILKTMYMYMY